MVSTSRVDRLALAVDRAVAGLDPGVQGHRFRLDRMLDLADVGEQHALARLAGPVHRDVVEAKDDVLRRHDDRLAVGRAEDVVRRHHQHARLELRFQRQRHVHRHLVAVEVGVEGGTDQRMQLDRLALDQHRLERLDAEAVQGRRPVEQHRVLADHLFEDIPDLRPLLLEHALGRLDRRREAVEFELGVDERLEQLERHLLRQAALVQLQLRANDDHRAAGVIDALAEQVLPEASLLALEHVGQRLQRPFAGAGDRPAAPAVVEQRVDRLLQHPLLVADDDLRSPQFDQPLQPVVAVDHPAVEIVEVRRREPAAVERHQRPQFRRNHRDDLKDHPLRPRLRFDEGLDQLQPLHQLLALRLRRGFLQIGAQLHLLGFGVDRLQHLADRFGADADGEALLAVLIDGALVLFLADQLARLQRRQAGIDDDVVLEVEDAFEVLQRHVEQQADAARQRLQEPDVRHRRGQFDMAHPLAPHLLQGDLDAALLADDPLVFHPLVLAAQALVVLDRAEDAGAEQPVAFRLERPVVDGFRLLDLAERPGADPLRAGDRDLDVVEALRAADLAEDLENLVHRIALT